MIRKGSLVKLDETLVKDHPVYSRFIGMRWKVDGIKGSHALVGYTRLPIKLLVGIPQKKGKNYTSKDHQKAA